jgi:hypothetical protein
MKQDLEEEEEEEEIKRKKNLTRAQKKINYF